MQDMKWLRETAFYGSIGLSIAFSIFIGLFLGIWFDSIFGTEPVFTFVFFAAGIAAGYRNIIKLIKKIRKL